VLLGPVQAATYLLNHGLLAGALGGLLAGRAPWALGVPAAAAVRVAGQLGFIALSGWTMNENLWALLLTNVFSLLVRAAPAVGRGMEQHSCMAWWARAAGGLCAAGRCWCCPVRQCCPKTKR